MDKQSKEMMSLINERKIEHMMTHLGEEHVEDVPPELHEYPTQPPPPSPATVGKIEIYDDPEVFSEVDQLAIQVGSRCAQQAQCARRLK